MQVTSSIPGTSLDEMLHVGARISAEVLKLPYVKTVEQQVGRAELGEDTWGPHRSEFHVELKPDATVDQAVAQQALRDILSHYAGIQSEVVTFLGDRISESLTGDTAQVDVKVFGDDLDALDGVGDQIMSVLGKEKGILSSKSTYPEGKVTVKFDSEAIDEKSIQALIADMGFTVESQHTV